MRAKLAMMAVAVSMAAGCATNGDQIFTPAGPRPTEQQARQGVLDYLSRSLKDPDSMKQFRVLDGMHAVTWQRGLVNGGGLDEAWMVCVEYNAKNSYGGYVGLQVQALGVRLYGDKVMVVEELEWMKGSC